MANPAPIISQINAFNATEGTIISFNIVGGTSIVRSNIIYIYDLSDNSLICTHLYISTEPIHELPANTDPSIAYASGKSSADFTNGKQYYAQIQTFTNTAGTEGASGASIAKLFWCLVDPTLTINAIPSSISTTSYNAGAVYNSNTTATSNIVQQYQFNLYSATGVLVQSSGVITGSGAQQGTSTAYDLSYNFTGLSVGSSYYVVVDVTTTQGMNVSTQSNTFTVSIDTPTLGEATVVNNACDGYISVVSNLSDEYGGHVSGEMASFETDSVNNVSSLKVNMEPIQEGSGTPSPTNIRPIRGHSGVNAYVSPTQSADDGTKYSQEFDVSLTPTSTDKVPYTFKAVGRDVYGDRESDKIVGGTVGWNQKATTLDTFGATNSVTRTYANGVATYTPTTFNTSNGIYSPSAQFKSISNHVYFCTVDINPDKQGYFDVGLETNGQARKVLNAGVYTNMSVVAKTANERAFIMYLKSTPSDSEWVAGDTFKAKNLMIFDLTQMFGTTIADYIYSLEQSSAGVGVAWFKKLFPKDYYEYDKGTLRSVEGVSAHEMVGFNQWDEEWEVGAYNGINGAKVATNDRIRVKNKIRVFPDTSYYIKSEVNIQLYEYGINEEYIRQKWSGSKNSIYRVSKDAHYITFNTAANTGTTYKNDICINISSDRNGEYEPYVKHTYPLDSNLTLRGVPKLVDGKLAFDGDVYPPSGEVQRRYGVVDLGTLNWKSGTDSINTVFYAKISNLKYVTDLTVVNAICPKFMAVTKVAWSGADINSDKVFRSDNSASILYFRDLAYTDAAAFKTAMSGVYLVYELATPATETAEPFTNPQVVDNRGTEAYITTGIVPVGHDTTYLTRDIFGGTLDLVTGVLTVDRAMVTINGSSNFTQRRAGTSKSLFGLDLASGQGGKAVAETSFPNVIANELPLETAYNAWRNETLLVAMTTSGNTIWFRLPSITALADAKTYLNSNPLQVCYELATPRTIQLTPHQIQTLVGQNNVWSDAGEVDVTFNLPITNLLVKRQDTADISGKWLTLYSQPITQASDMDFTFIDFLNQYGKTYKYALVPLLTQEQSGVEVEVEGGYTVSDEVVSIFDGVFVADNTAIYKLKAGVNYGDLSKVQEVGSINTIGSKYPIIVSNSKVDYRTASLSATIVADDYYDNGNLNRMDMVQKRELMESFFTNKRAKILKDWNGNIWLVVFIDNINITFINEYGMGIATLTAAWTEIGDVTNEEDLQNTRIINVG